MKVTPISPIVFMLRFDKPALYDRRTKKEKPYVSIKEAWEAKLEVERGVDIFV